MRVLMTQMGLVIRTVALPAMAPAIMDSTVVSFCEARPDRRAAREKRARVHSYPGFWEDGLDGTRALGGCDDDDGGLRRRSRTIIIHKICNADTEQGGV